MKLCDEEFYFNYISLKTLFISFDDYKKWLNEIFLRDNSQNEIILKLEWHTGDLEKTIDELYIYLYDKLSSLDYHVVAKMIINELKVKYANNPESLKELTHKLYDIWNLLPSEIVDKEPFFTLNHIDDPWSWGDEEQVKKSINWLFSYYN